MSGRITRAAGLTWALAACAALGACDLVLGIPDRTLDPHVVCADGECACGHGFADCDGDPANGCEADLSSAATCGACGHDCQNGDCVDGACKCHAKFADCDGDPANGCEASFETDAKNCGACGHGCLGAACQGSLCEPIQVGKFGAVAAIQVVAGSVYIAGCDALGTVVEYPADGGAPVAAVAASGSNDCGNDMSIAGDTVFWVDDPADCIESIVSNPLGKPATPKVLVPNVSPFPFAAGPTAVYWGDDSVTGLQRIPATGGTPEQIPATSGATILAIAADATHAYFSDENNLYSVPHTGTTVTKLAPIAADSILVAGETLYVADDQNLQSLPITGGKPRILSPVGDVQALAVDGTFVYWSDFGSGTINKVPLAGGRRS